MDQISGLNDIRFKIAAARRMLYREGCDSGVAGHVSARAPGEDAFYVTPFGFFDETLPDHVIKVDFDLNVLEGTWKPSPAIQFHRAIYQARPDVNSVIHTHSHYVSVLSTTHQPLGMYNVLSVIFYKDIVLYADDGTRPAVEGPRIAATLGPHRAMIIANHGAINVADTLEHATVEAIALEKAARYQVDAMRIGGREIPVAEVLRGREAYLVEGGYREQTWQALLRRLRKSDPELFVAAGVAPEAVDLYVAQMS